MTREQFEQLLRFIAERIARSLPYESRFVLVAMPFGPSAPEATASISELSTKEVIDVLKAEVDRLEAALPMKALN